jgi:hypothetical protein
VLDPVTTVLELGAVALLAVGLVLVVAVSVGGLLGVGLGLVAAAGVLAAASGMLRWLQRPTAAGEPTPGRRGGDLR